MSTQNEKVAGMIAHSIGSSGGRYGKTADNASTNGMMAVQAETGAALPTTPQTTQSATVEAITSKPAGMRAPPVRENRKQSTLGRTDTLSLSFSCTKFRRFHGERKQVSIC